MRLVVIIFVMSVTSLSFAQTDSIFVKVTINASESIQAEVESYIKRELRTVGDVTIVDEARLLKRIDRPSMFESLSICMLPINNKAGNMTGYVASILYSIYFDIYNDSSDKIKRKIEMDERYRFMERFPSHSVSIYDTNLKAFCQKIVADFDTEVLEKDRKISQQIREFIEDTNEDN